MPAYELTGTVKEVMETVTFDSGFTKREFVVTTEDDRYPQDIKFECVKDKTALLDSVTPGQRVTVSFDLRGNAYKDRYFVNLSAWRIATPGAEGDAAGGDDDSPPLPTAAPDDLDMGEPPF